MRKGSIAMLALAMIIAGMGKAGEYGKVTLSKEVYEVGEKGATVTVTDGTGGYKAGAGKGFGKVDASFTGKGTHPITISNKPSEEPGDSGVTVTYPAPKSGEEEKSVTAKCTVVKLKINGAFVEAFEPVISGSQYHYVIVSVDGGAHPAGLGNIYITAKPTSGLWIGGTKIESPEYYSTLFSMERIDGGTSKGIRFDIDVDYAGIKKSEFRLSKSAVLNWFWKWLLSLLYS